MHVSQIAAQLYTVRDQMKTPAEVAGALKKVARIGYGAVEFGGLPAMPVDDVAAMLSDNGLTCCSTHGAGEADMLDDPAAAVKVLAKLDCPCIAYPYPSGVPLDTIDDALALAKRLNAAGKAYHAAGIALAYHNHAIEFKRLDGRLILDVLYEETDPRYLQGEPDTYWIQYGGGDSVQWCRKLAGRLPLLHMKDYKITPEGHPAFAEVGHGNLDWKKIVAAAEDGACEWYIVEQDRCDGDPFDSIKMSFDYIRDTLCS
jgi:sugar phosphate isomerase/epimerase